MICPYCKAREASIIFKQVTDEGEKVLHVCAECAQQHGLSIQLSLPLLSDFLFGPGLEPPEDPLRTLRCPNCHMHAADLQKHSLLGCAVCYPTFAEDVEEMLDGMQRGKRHMGKVPEAHRDGCLRDLARAIEVAAALNDVREVERLKGRMQMLSPRPRLSPRSRNKARGVHGATGDGPERAGQGG